MSGIQNCLTIENLELFTIERKNIIEKNNGKMISMELMDFNSRLYDSIMKSEMSFSLSTFFDIDEEIIIKLHRLIGFVQEYDIKKMYLVCAQYLMNKFNEYDRWCIEQKSFINNFTYINSVEIAISIFNKDNLSLSERIMNSCGYQIKIIPSYRIMYLMEELNDKSMEDINIFLYSKLCKNLFKKGENIDMISLISIYKNIYDIDINHKFERVDQMMKMTFLGKDIITLLKCDDNIFNTFYNIFGPNLLKYKRLMTYIYNNFQKYSKEISEYIIPFLFDKSDEFIYKFINKINKFTCNYLYKDLNPTIENIKCIIKYCFLSPHIDENDKDIADIIYSIISPFSKFDENIEKCIKVLNVILNDVIHSNFQMNKIILTLKILINIKDISNIYTKCARLLLMKKFFNNKKELTKCVLRIEPEKSIFEKINYNHFVNFRVNKLYTGAIDVHAKNRDDNTVKVLKRLMSLYQDEWSELDKNYDIEIFNEFMSYMKENVKGDDRIKFIRVMGISSDEDYEYNQYHTEDYSPLLVENTTIKGEEFIPHQLITYFWKFCNEYKEESEILKDTFLKCILNSFDHRDGKEYAICNPGKLQKYCIFLLQGRLKNADGTLCLIDEILPIGKKNLENNAVEIYLLIKPFIDEISTKSVSLEVMFEQLFDYVITNKYYNKISEILEVVCLYSETNSGFIINPELSFASCYEGMFNLDDYILSMEFNGLIDT